MGRRLLHRKDDNGTESWQRDLNSVKPVPYFYEGLIYSFESSCSQSTPGKMIDDHEQATQNELDPFIQHEVKVPTKQEANVARAQFLALCWGMFVMGWTNSSTGPLLLRIQTFYDVSSLGWPIHYSFDYFFNISILQVGLGPASWVFVSLRMVSDVYGARDTRLLWRLAYMAYREKLWGQCPIYV